MVNIAYKHFWRQSVSGDDNVTTMEDDEIPLEAEKKALLQNGFLQTEKSLNTFIAGELSMNLLPFKEQKQLVIMFYEAYAIFAALFLNGIWFVWEFGSSKEFQNETLGRAFEILCAWNMMSAILLALFGTLAWFFSIQFAATTENWIFGNRHFKVEIHYLCMFVWTTTLVSMLIGSYNRLYHQDHISDSIVAITVPILIFLKIFYSMMKVWQVCVPLETFHHPGNYNHLKEEAQKRVEFLKKRFPLEKPTTTTITTTEESAESTFAQSKGEGMNEIQKLLQKACDRLGRSDFDLTPCLAKLEGDWYDTVEQLKGESLDVLQRYMPRMLAKTVHELLEEREPLTGQ